jgi:hypothetical protein
MDFSNLVDFIMRSTQKKLDINHPDTPSIKKLEIFDKTNKLCAYIKELAVFTP